VKASDTVLVHTMPSPVDNTDVEVLQSTKCYFNVECWTLNPWQGGTPPTHVAREHIQQKMTGSAIEIEKVSSVW